MKTKMEILIVKLCSLAEEYAEFGANYLMPGLTKVRGLYANTEIYSNEGEDISVYLAERNTVRAVYFPNKIEVALFKNTITMPTNISLLQLQLIYEDCFNYMQLLQSKSVIKLQETVKKQRLELIADLESQLKQLTDQN